MKKCEFSTSICDSLFGTIKLNLSEDEKKIYGTLELAKQNPIDILNQQRMLCIRQLEFNII